jgi:Winged helix DNA-binding domain
MVEAISRRALNRATLARQGLLERQAWSPVEAVERLAGMQAQEPRPPFAGLWTRLEGFDPEALRTALADRRLVRASWLRATLHLVTAADYAAFRATLHPVLAGARESVLKARGAVLDLDAVHAAARELLAGRPHTFDELRAELLERFPEADHRAMGYTVRMELPLVMVPTEDRWAFPRAAEFTPAETWLRKRASGKEAREELVRRYLAAFGPATAADAQTWSGLKGVKATLDGLRDELVTFKDGRRELFDLPDAPRPGEDAAAPPRLLPDFDNLLLAHADRTRVIADQHKPAVFTKNLRVRATFLLDGEVAGTWSAERKGKNAVLTLAPFGALPRGTKGPLTDEAATLLRMLEPDAASHDVAVERG